MSCFFCKDYERTIFFGKDHLKTIFTFVKLNLINECNFFLRIFVATSETNSVQALNMDGDSDGVITK